MVFLKELWNKFLLIFMRRLSSSRIIINKFLLLLPDVVFVFIIFGTRTYVWCTFIKIIFIFLDYIIFLAKMFTRYNEFILWTSKKVTMDVCYCFLLYSTKVHAKYFQIVNYDYSCTKENKASLTTDRVVKKKVTW